MVAAPLYSLSFKRNCKCIKSSFWDLTVYDQYRYCNDWNSDSFRNVDDSEGEKKRSENRLENSCFEGKRAQNTQSKDACNFYYEDSFCFFRDFFLGYLY